MASANNTKLPKDLIILKWVVIAMGLALVGGTILLFSLLYNKVNKESAENAENNIVFTPSSNNCEFKVSQLNVSGEVVAASTNKNILTLILKDIADNSPFNSVVSGNSVTLTTKTPVTPFENRHVLVVDMCTGKTLSRIDLVQRDGVLE